MRTLSSAKPFDAFKLTGSLVMMLALWLLVSLSVHAAPLTINVIGVGANGATMPVDSYRWTVEEDATKASVPGRPADTSNYSFSFHTSYMPVVAAGRVGGAKDEVLNSARAQDPDYARLLNQPLPDLVASKRYYVSVAAEGYQMGGAPVVFDGNGNPSATVYLNQYPLPTAQISVFVFNDNSPINGAPDLPQETGLAGFHVRLIEAGGTYGMSGGEVTQDAFGNPLGTIYADDQGTVAPNGRGAGIIKTDANGVALIKNLYPAKYTILVVPPNGSDWHQTSTIEGTRGVDAWVKNNEPSFFQEFGPPGHHVFIGFTRSGSIAQANGAAIVPAAVGNAVTGRIVNTHHSRPPVYTFFNGAPVDNCWVGLNEANGGRALYAAPCNKDSTFSIPSVPAGIYELVVWDEPLDMIIAATTITVGNAPLALGDVPVSSWFGRYQGRVFQDIDGTGSPKFESDFTGKYIRVDRMTGKEYEVDCALLLPAVAPEGVVLPSRRELCPLAGDLKPPFGSGIASNIRFRDGSIYQSVATKDDGTFGFTEVFPFFNWMIAEIDFARFKATGATTVVDGGGEVNATANKSKLWDAPKGLFGSTDPVFAYDPWGRLNPQCQQYSTTSPITCLRYHSTDQGVVLTYGMQTFLGQTNHVEWGKQPYGFEKNGGIAGIVQYAITRAEDDPRLAAAEPWEPGIPRVQMNLFIDCDGDGLADKPDPANPGQCSQLSTDTNYVASDGSSLPGGGYKADPPDVDNYPFGWRDGGSKGPEDRKRSRTGSLTTFSQGDVFVWGPTGSQDIGIGATDSWDDNLPGGCPDPSPYSVPSTGERLDCFDGLRNFNQVRPALFDGGFGFGSVAGQAELPVYLGAQGKGKYIVEAVAPAGYLHQGNGDKNVVFGDTLKASPAALPHECVGMELDVPAVLSLFPGEANPNYEAGQRKWRKCDMKAVPLNQGQNAAPNFFMYTEAPVAGHAVGFILDDTAAEFNYFAPTFGEKYSPPHLPVSIQDWTGREISRVYSDQFGSYNFLVPSSFTLNPPYPSGVMPSMMVACMNHPGPVPVLDANGVPAIDPATGQPKVQIDPYFHRSYSTFCYTFQYLPGKTTYLDTPVVPIAAFAPIDKNPLDCECADGTPAIYSVTNGTNGPWVPGAGTPITIIAMGKREVTNPAFDPSVTDTTDMRSQKVIVRDFGFGATAGSVTLGGLPLTGVNWSDGIITATVPSGAATGQLMVKRGGPDGKESVVGVTVHVGGAAPRTVNPNGSDGVNCGVATPCKTIQAAVEAAGAGELITVAPGTYNEYVIVDKRVRLQGWGAGSTYINAAKSATTGLADWRRRINAKAGNTFDLLPGQELGIDAANNEPLLFGAEEGPGILVVGKAGILGGIGPFSDCLLGNTTKLAIDGLSITGSDSGGAILASGYACGIELSNNRITGNYGTYGGGVRIGHTALLAPDNTFTDGVNRAPNIHHNWISQNGATGAGGAGGITLGTGSNGYAVTNNYVCGNFSMSDGGGLSHLGLSPGSIVSGSSTPANRVLDNKFYFNQTFNQAADPMGGGVSIAGQIPVGGGASTGTGDVLVDGNVVQGNQAGAGAGGGISIARTTNADDVVLTNNMIVNNVAAYTGGGVAITQGGSNVRLVNNTIASNVSTATNRQAFGANAPQDGSLPQIAGLTVLSGSSPTLLNNILWANRSYIYRITGTTTALYDPVSGQAAYADLGRLDNAAMTPRYSVFTDTPANRAAFGADLTNCGNSTPTSLPIGCNRYVAAASADLFVKANAYNSIIDPTQPVVLPEATVNLQTALTFDETGNFVNVIFSPLTLWEMSGPNVGLPRADYHLADTTTNVAINNGRAPNASAGDNTTIGAGFVPAADFERQPRPAGTTAAIDIGADEILTPGPIMSVSPTTVAFGTQSLNTTRSATITVQNIGTAVLTLAAPTLTGTNASQFSLATTCSAPLAPFTGCTITVSFRPTSILAKTATLTVAGTGVASVPVALSGTGVIPGYSINPNPVGGLNFGAQQVGTQSAPRQFTVTNLSASLGNLVFTGNPSLSGTYASQFSAAFRAGDTCTTTTSLAPGQSCTFSVVFAPTSVGLKGTNLFGNPLLPGASVHVSVASGLNTTILPQAGVRGTGVAPNPSLGAGTQPFGNVNGSTTRTLTLTNTGATAAPFVISTITVTKTNNGNGTYALAGGTCTIGSPVAAGGTCTVIVSFASPSGNSTTTGTLSVTGTGVGGIGSASASRNLTGQ